MQCSTMMLFVDVISVSAAGKVQEAQVFEIIKKALDFRT